MTTIVQSLYFSVLPERHVAVRIEDAVEPRPARDGGGGRGRRRLSPHGQQRRPLCWHLVHLLLILEVSFLITDCLLSFSTWIRFCSPFSSASVGGASLDIESCFIHTRPVWMDDGVVYNVHI